MKLKRIIQIFIAMILIVTTTIPVQAVDTILGVPISKFDNINNAKSKLTQSISDMDSYSNEQYKLKYQFDAYGFAYYVLEVKELLGVGSVSTLEEHIKFYNLSIKDPLTSEDAIDFTGTGDDMIVTTISQTYLDKMNALIGVEADTEKNNNTLISQISKLRKGAGFQTKLYNKNNLTWKDSKLSEAELETFIRENISEIRILLTITKQFVDDYYTLIDYDHLNFLSNYFAETYDFFVQFSKEVDIEGLKDIDLFGKDAELTFDPNRQGGYEDLGEWNINGNKQNLEKMSEHMLKGIAASSTFRPFETNMNSTEAFSFLGKQMQLFHEAYGTKRKLIMTPTDGYNNLNTGLDLNATKNVKLLTLRDFIEKPNDVKVLYLDNIDYDISQIEDAQQAIKEGEVKQEGAEEGTFEDTTETTVKDNNRGFWANINHGINSTASYMNSNKYLDWLVLDKGPIAGMEGTIESVLFATGDVTKVSKVKKSLKNNIELVNMSTLVYKNIMAEYGTNSKRKLKADMDKPMTVDIYGNILSASGIVIIPAVSNPFIWGNTKPIFLFNRAFIESYPEYIIENGVISTARGTKNKKAIALEPMTEKEIEEQEKRTKGTIDVSGTLDEGVEIEKPEGGLKFTESLGDEVTPVLGGVQGYITSAGKSAELSNSLKLPDFKPTIDKFDDSYEPMKSLDLFTFPIAKDYDLDEYSKVRENFTLLKSSERVATIDNYTVKLTYSEEGTSEVVTFKDVPESDELKRFLYLSNLQELIEVKNGNILDKVRLAPLAYKVLEEVYKNGVYNLNELNNLMTDGTKEMYDKYITFLLEKANNRYESVLGTEASNNLLYNSNLEENKALKSFLPYLFKFILIVGIASIIIAIAMSVFSKEGKFKNIIRTFTVLYLIVFLIQISPWVYEHGINNPLRALMSKDTITWTVLEQEDNLHRVKQVTKDELIDKPLDEGSEIKLYKLDYTYPFKLLKTPKDSGVLTVDEYYEGFLNNDKAFSNQNNKMWVDGRYVVTNTNSLFESSRVVVDKPDDVLMKLTHEVYKQPELGYYMPYYMFIDNIVHNLNVSTELTKRIPNETYYESGDVRTTGRMKDYLSSAMFLDYEEFEKRIKNYKSSDRISEELSEAALETIVADYGEHEDHLGISKILNMTEDLNLAPFDESQIEKATKSAWYPRFDYISREGKDGKPVIYDYNKLTYEDKMEIQKAADKVNIKTKNFMLSLHPFVDKVSDETLIKTIALYASFEFNKAFSKWQSNDYMPTSLELRDISAERLLMAMSLKSEDLLDTEFSSYPLKVVSELGYFGLLISTYNDTVIVLINYLKPFIAILIWGMSALIIFTRKVIIPDPRNSSILGSFKSLVLFTLLSVAYGVSIWLVIKLINMGAHPWISHGMTTIFSTAYLIALGFMVFFIIRDFRNIGSAYFFKGTEKAAKFYANAAKGMLGNTALARSTKFSKALNAHSSNLERLGGNMDNKALRSMETTGDIDFMKPLDFSAKSISKAASTVQRTSKDIVSAGIKSASTMKRTVRNTAAIATTATTGIPIPLEQAKPKISETPTPPKVSKDGKVETKIDISMANTPPKVGSVAPTQSTTQNATQTQQTPKGLGASSPNSSRYDNSSPKTNYFNRNK